MPLLLLMNKVPVILIASILLLPANSQAQIIPDSSLPTNSQVIENLDRILIEAGTSKGENLFHSFRDFNVGDKPVHFNNSGDIGNIFSRVTGSNQSLIDGILGANGTANLFLINSNGIIFTENASLDIGGSFTATTGDILFSDDSLFEASPTTEAPLLTVAIPVGIQLNNAPGTIEVTGAGNEIFSDPDFFHPNTDFRPAGITANTINFAASSIVFDGGNISSPDGAINLVASSEGTIDLEDWSLNTTATGTIDLLNAASTSTSGEGAGMTNITTRNLSIVNGSAILNTVKGFEAGGELNIKAETIDIIGFSEGHNSIIASDIEPFYEGNSGAINIEVNNLNLVDGGLISSVSYGSGTSGDINIDARIIELVGEGLIPSAITSQVNDLGDSGDINITAKTISLDEFAEISSINFWDGIAGNLNIQAETIDVTNDARIILATTGLDTKDLNINAKELNLTDGGSITGLNVGFGQLGEFNIKSDNIYIAGSGLLDISGIYNITNDEGNSGAINIETNNLTLLEGGVIEGSSDFTGDPANINIKAQNIVASGFGYEAAIEANTPSGIITSKAFDTESETGNIYIEADLLDFSNGAQLSTNTNASGNAGDITLNIDKINLDGFVAEGRTAILSNATSGIGNGGSITINTTELNITNGASITASNFASRRTDLEPGSGNPGTIQIESDSLKLSSDSEASTITTKTVSGRGGTIELRVESLLLDRGIITSETVGSGSGGIIQIKTNNLDLTSNSLISTDATGSGDAGTIDIAAQQAYLGNSTITSTASDLGAAGNLNLDFNDLKTSRGKIIAESTLTGGGDILLNSDRLELNHNSLISTSVRDSTGGGGNISINNQNLIWLRNNSDIRANAIFGAGGNIDINTQFLFTSLNSEIDASSQFGVDGIVRINENIEQPIISQELPESYQPSQVISSLCPIAKESNFAVTGKGGIAENPLNPQNYNRDIWENWETANNKKPIVQNNLDRNNQPTPIIQEANFLSLNKRGELELIANNNLVSIQNSDCK